VEDALLVALLARAALGWKLTGSVVLLRPF